MPDIEWTPLPGHHPGQSREDVLYVSGEYRGMYCELFQNHGVFQWSFYDDGSYDPELAVARGDRATRWRAELDLIDYIDGHVAEREDNA